MIKCWPLAHRWWFKRILKGTILGWIVNDYTPFGRPDYGLRPDFRDGGPAGAFIGRAWPRFWIAKVDTIA